MLINIQKKLMVLLDFIFDWTITNSENSKSITLPLYMSFDFDENGKFNYIQYFGDITAAFSSIE